MSSQVLIGNDIVDLAEEDCTAPNWFVRFCRKVLSESEERHVHSSSLPRTTLWSYWAAKEAAYKAVRRIHPEFEFEYKEFFVSESFDCVQVNEIDLRLQLAVNNDCIHALCWNEAAAANRIYSWVEKMPPDCQISYSAESKFVRRLLVERLADEMNISVNSLHLFAPRFGGAAPEVYCNFPSGRFPVSLSHHGRFAASAAAIRGELNYDEHFNDDE